MRRILEDGPPEQRAGHEVHRVLEVEECRRVLERRVVGGRQVPGEVDEQPEAKRDRRTGQLPDGRDAPEPLGDGRRDAEHEQRRRPLGEDDVLEQVHREQVVAQCFERGDRGGEQEQAAPREGRDAPPLDVSTSCRQDVGEHQRGYAERRLGVDGPGVGVGAGDRALR